ncbi:hypothetical protein BIV57_07640 [Mangrovactinospora gilvigrisea]|uniref:Uncharacterized protein n=1 Tax=Mangrovactinospora gilvigrisea TaxID=1428644 RepID=A0A1J7BHA1_9ACTN|nr:hypothetical protein [Mangrovactinospora gilvigrisea]OIV38075.1 hypothetical protein BIV57_07640 [Mangrovactinospora gilvigrisea]
MSDLLPMSFTLLDDGAVHATAPTTQQGRDALSVLGFTEHHLAADRPYFRLAPAPLEEQRRTVTAAAAGLTALGMEYEVDVLLAPPGSAEHIRTAVTPGQQAVAAAAALADSGPLRAADQAMAALAERASALNLNYGDPRLDLLVHQFTSAVQQLNTVRSYLRDTAAVLREVEADFPAPRFERFSAARSTTHLSATSSAAPGHAEASAMAQPAAARRTH